MIQKTSNDISRIKLWLLASRPKTLPAAFAPVFVGSALAIHHNSFKFLNALIALICSILIQVGTNFVNDLFDFLHGTDKKERLGPTRAVVSGLISPTEMKYAIVITFAFVFLLGLFLVYQTTLWILLIGILSIIAGIAYTAGPYPLAYHALGDLFVLIFFGFVGTVGTYYVQSFEANLVSFLISIPVGALITNILVVNNLRDIDEDKVNNKITLAVIIGRSATKIQYAISILISFMILFIVYFYFIPKATVFLPLILLPFAYILIKMIYQKSGKELNKILGLTAVFSAIFSLLLAIGIAI